ncbi:MAG: hypothetical protein IT245_06265 [Bacteroidia bacterium]|nr:hypothetical protein [Bacteroidia bacterium]
MIKRVNLIYYFLFITNNLFADLKYQPIQFSIKTEKESYYEGEKITFIISMTNIDRSNAYPVLLPHTQNTGNKLLQLILFDKAQNYTLVRGTENPEMNMMVHDTGSILLKYIQPLEKIEYKIHLNDFENYYSYHTTNSSHHSFGTPIFPGKYRISVLYIPYGHSIGDSIYSYYNGIWSSPGDQDFINHKPNTQEIPWQGVESNKVDLKILKSPENIVSIEGNKYFIKPFNRAYYYFKDSMGVIGKNEVYVSNIPIDSFICIESEFSINHTNPLYSEYIIRFDDRDIKEYIKYKDSFPDVEMCKQKHFSPNILLCVQFNSFKKYVFYAEKISNIGFISYLYQQPLNKIHQETNCTEDGLLCVTKTYTYDATGELINTSIYQFESK